jgi:hypothetical protein
MGGSANADRPQGVIPGQVDLVPHQGLVPHGPHRGQRLVQLDAASTAQGACALHNDDLVARLYELHRLDPEVLVDLEQVAQRIADGIAPARTRLDGLREFAATRTPPPLGVARR